jgi:hypothetical protein
VCGELVVGVNFNECNANALTNGPTPKQPSVGTTNATGRVSGPVAETLQEAGEDPQRLVKVRPAKLADNKLADTSSPASVAAAAANACRLSIFGRLGKHMAQIHEPVSSSSFGIKTKIAEVRSPQSAVVVRPAKFDDNNLADTSSPAAAAAANVCL